MLLLSQYINSGDKCFHTYDFFCRTVTRAIHNIKLIFLKKLWPVLLTEMENFNKHLFVLYTSMLLNSVHLIVFATQIKTLLCKVSQHLSGIYSPELN